MFLIYQWFSKNSTAFSIVEMLLLCNFMAIVHTCQNQTAKDDARQH